MIMSLIELSEVSKLYGFGDATTIALDEVSLTINKGEFVAVMGPSGSGKSTLMHMLGLLDRPTHGTYMFNGRLITRMSASRRARLRRDTLGFVFQSSNLIPRLNVLENVALPLAYKGMTQTRRLKQAGAVLEQIGLADREYFLPKQLSGGQTQRVAIARALVNNPDVIIADEPTGNLDSASSLLVMELLSDLHKMGHTILLVTHNPELTRYSTRVVFMRDGLIIADEQTQVGSIPALARKLYFMQHKTFDDDLTGVSALMKALTGDDKKRGPKKIKKSKPKSIKRPGKKRGSK